MIYDYKVKNVIIIVQLPRVLYFSIHRYEHGKFWPNLRESDFDHIGNRNGTGFNVNVPLNDIGMKNEDYMAIIHYLLIPLATEVINNINKNKLPTDKKY